MINNLAKLAIENGGNITPILIPSELTGGTGLCNPSINIIDGELKLNLRHVQYTLYHSEGEQKFPNQWGPLAYLNPEDDLTLTTQNFLCNLDSNTLNIESFVKVDTSKLDVKPIWEFVGLEDARLVKWEGREFLCGVRRDTTPNGEGRMELSEIVDGKEIARYRIEPPNGYSYCEKNWMPINDMPFHFVKWSNPTEVVKVDLETLSSKTITLSKTKIDLPRDLRGGSQVIKYEDYYIALTHEVDLFFNEPGQKDAQYYHRFIVWDKDWNIINTTDEFKFFNAAIEFSCGMVIHNGSLLISIGFQDNTSYIVQLPLQFFEKFLNGGDLSTTSKIMQLQTPKLVEDFVLDSLNPTHNFNLGEFYFKKSHTSSALSLFLRAAEFGVDDDLTYESLIKVAKCLNIQGRRSYSEKSSFENAVMFQPSRPEAYFFLSQYYESRNDWFSANVYSNLAFNFINNFKPTQTDIGIEDKYVFIFQKAVTSWWVGQGKLSRELFFDLLNNNKDIISEKYKNLIQHNLTSLCGVEFNKPKKAVYYNLGEDPMELNNTGYLINDLQLAQGLAANNMFTFEINLIHKVIENYSDLTKDFIDIGAHVGTYSWLTAPHFNHVHSFEPNKEVYNYLCGNIALRGLSDKIDTYLLGISDKEANLKYYERSKDGGGNGFENIKTKEKTISKSSLPVKTLDSFNFDNVGFIKIDVEGHEKSVLLGAKQTLKNNNYPPILFESWAPGEHPSHGKEYITNLRKELFDVVKSYGYTIHEWWSEIFLAIKES